MEKPISLSAQEFNEKLVTIINESNLPSYVLKIELEKIYNQIVQLEQQQIEEYNTSNKESDNND